MTRAIPVAIEGLDTERPAPVRKRTSIRGRAAAADGGVARPRVPMLGATILLASAALLLLLAAAAPPPPTGTMAAAAPAASTVSAVPATPEPTPAVTADLRSSGQGAGPAGNPMGAVWAALVVLLLGGGTAAATVVYVRVTDRSRIAAGGRLPEGRASPHDGPRADHDEARTRAEADG